MPRAQAFDPARWQATLNELLGRLGRDVAAALADRDLACTTVMTVLERRAREGLARRERGAVRTWRYASAAMREIYITELMLDALSLTADRDAALARFARSVSDAEAQALQEALGISSVSLRRSRWRSCCGPALRRRSGVALGS